MSEAVDIFSLADDAVDAIRDAHRLASVLRDTCGDAWRDAEACSADPPDLAAPDRFAKRFIEIVATARQLHTRLGHALESCDRRRENVAIELAMDERHLHQPVQH